jgi:hypothetical protein
VHAERFAISLNVEGALIFKNANNFNNSRTEKVIA